MDEREVLEECEVDDDRGGDREGHAAEEPFYCFLRADPRRQFVFPEGAAEVVGAAVSEPDHEQEEEDQLGPVGEIVVQPDQRSAEHAHVERRQDGDGARRQRLFEAAARKNVIAGDHQQGNEDAHLDGDGLEDERGDDEQHDRDAERDGEVIALPLAEVEELVKRERGHQGHRRIEDVRVRPADHPDGQGSGDECSQLTLHGLSGGRRLLAYDC